MVYKYPEDWNTGPVRIRLLSHWSSSKDSTQGYWLLTIEPQWPLMRFSSHEEHLYKTIFPIKDEHSLDVVLEHYKPGMLGRGDCQGTILGIDLYDLAKWMK